MNQRPPPQLAALFMEVVPKAMREFRKEMRNSSRKLTVPQFRILAQLSFEPANNRALAEQQGVSVAAMSRMVECLHKRGLIERFELKSDRRQVQLKLTRKGREQFESFRKEARVRLQKRLRLLNVDDQKSLNRGLEALSLVLEHMVESV